MDGKLGLGLGLGLGLELEYISKQKRHLSMENDADFHFLNVVITLDAWNEQKANQSVLIITAAFLQES